MIINKTNINKMNIIFILIIFVEFLQNLPTSKERFMRCCRYKQGTCDTIDLSATGP